MGTYRWAGKPCEGCGGDGKDPEQFVASPEATYGCCWESKKNGKTCPNHPEAKVDETLYFDDMVEAERILEEARVKCYKKRCPQLWCQDQKETIAKALSRSLLSSRQSAIEECVKAVETASKVPCENCSHMFCISKRLSLSALRRLLREESEDKKDGV